MAVRAKVVAPSQPFDKRALLRAHPFFKKMDDPMIDRLALHAITRKMKKSAVVFRKGDIGNSLYAVCAGAVRISAPSEQGKDAIFNLIVPGEIFGEIAFLDGGERTADAVVIESGELLVIERRDFLPMLADHPEVAMKLIEILCERLRRTSEQVEDIVFLGLPVRLAKVLLHLYRRAIAASPTGKIRVTQRELSQMIGVSRESANKQLQTWQRRKWLKVERGGISILAPEALHDLISE
jgi:CRP/FNR family transcriptional regulator, cyclic AMP receptor protein